VINLITECSDNDKLLYMVVLTMLKFFLITEKFALEECAVEEA